MEIPGDVVVEPVIGGDAVDRILEEPPHTRRLERLPLKVRMGIPDTTRAREVNVDRSAGLQVIWKMPEARPLLITRLHARDAKRVVVFVDRDEHPFSRSNAVDPQRMLMIVCVGRGENDIIKSKITPELTCSFNFFRLSM